MALSSSPEYKVDHFTSVICFDLFDFHVSANLPIHRQAGIDN